MKTSIICMRMTVHLNKNDATLSKIKPLLKALYLFTHIDCRTKKTVTPPVRGLLAAVVSQPDYPVSSLHALLAPVFNLPGFASP